MCSKRLVSLDFVRFLMTICMVIASEDEEPKRNAPLAQLVEQLTLNQWVPGSNP